MALISGNSSLGNLDQKMISGGIFGGYPPQSVGVAASICIESPDSNWFFKDVITNNAASRVVASLHNHSNPRESYLAFYDPLTLQPVGVGTTSVPSGITAYEFTYDDYWQLIREDPIANVQIIGTFNPVPHQDKFLALAEDSDGIIYIAFFDMDGNLQKVWKPKTYGNKVDTTNSSGDIVQSEGAYGPITTDSKYGSVKMISSNSMIAIGRTADSGTNTDNNTRNYYSGTGDGMFIFKFAYPATFYGPKFVQNIPPPPESVKDYWPDKMDMDSKHIITSARGGDSGSPHGGGSYVRVHDINGNFQLHIGDHGDLSSPDVTEGYPEVINDTANPYWYSSSSDSHGSSRGYYPVYSIDHTEGPYYAYDYINYNVGSVGDVSICGGKIYIGLVDQPYNRSEAGVLEIYTLKGEGTDRFERLVDKIRIPNNDTYSLSTDAMGTDVYVGSGRIVWGSPTGTTRVYSGGYQDTINSGKIHIYSTDVENNYNLLGATGGSLERYDVFKGQSLNDFDGVLASLCSPNSYWTVKYVRSGLITLATSPPLGSTDIASRIKILRTPDSVHIFDIVDQK